MRKILFRAKRIDNCEWVSGYYVYDYAHNAHFIFKNQLVCPNCINDRRIDYSVCDYEIDPDTLCQYTGMKDKNGNRMWENDIVSINTYSYMEPEEDYFGQVIYAEGWGCWCIQQPDDERPIPLCECKGRYQTDIFVEGNIFDNTELLKGDQSCTDL